MQRKVIETKSIHSFVRAVKCWEYPQVVKLVIYEFTRYDLSEIEELQGIAKRVIATYDGMKLYCSRDDWRDSIKKELLK